MRKVYNCTCRIEGDEFIEKLIFDSNNPEEEYKELLQEFNKEEFSRYKDKSSFRTFVRIMRVEDVE